MNDMEEDEDADDKEPVLSRNRLDFRRSLVSGLRPSPSGEERGLLSRTVAGDRA